MLGYRNLSGDLNAVLPPRMIFTLFWTGTKIVLVTEIAHLPRNRKTTNILLSPLNITSLQSKSLLFL